MRMRGGTALAAMVVALGVSFGTRLAAEDTSAPSAPAAVGADQSAELAKQIQNPVAALISVPFQSNFEWGSGPQSKGFKYTLNVQPVIPISISEDWNLISRTIVPIIHQDDVIPDTDQTGIGDITQSLFFSPKAPGPAGLIWEWVRSSCCRPRPISWGRKSSASGRPPSSSGRTTAGPMACSPITSLPSAGRAPSPT